MTKSEAKAAHDALNKAWDAFASEWSGVAQSLADEKGELDEKFSELSEKAQEGPRGAKLTEKIEELGFVDELDPEAHGDADQVNTVIVHLRTVAGLE